MGKIIDKLKEKFKIGEKGIRGLFLALGIGIGATGATAVHTMLPDGNNKPIEAETEIDTTQADGDSFKSSLAVDSQPQLKTENEEIEELDYEQILSEIINEYNEKYDTNLTKNDLLYIKSNPQFLGIDENGEYVQDYKEKTEVESYLTDGIKDVYIIINNQYQTVIKSINYI